MNNTGTLPRLRGAAIFLVLCLLLQGGLYLLFSEPCAAWICSAAARVTAEQVTLDDDGVLEYHAMRGAVAGAHLLVVGCDSSVNGTAELVKDLLTFLKRCTNVCTVVIDLPESAVEQVNLFLADEPIYLPDLLLEYGATAETRALIEGVASLNGLLPPARQLSFRSSELSWTLGGEVGEPICYLADRSLGAAPLGEIDDMLKYREGVVTVDLRYQASPGCAEDDTVLPLAGEAGSIWLIDHAEPSWPTSFYRFVVTRTRGGRLSAMADAMEAERGDYTLVLVGAEAAAPLE